MCRDSINKEKTKHVKWKSEVIEIKSRWNVNQLDANREKVEVK